MLRRRKERRYLQRKKIKRKPSLITRSNMELLPLAKMWT
jgi:hypothetical protein